MRLNNYAQIEIVTITIEPHCRHFLQYLRQAIKIELLNIEIKLSIQGGVVANIYSLGIHVRVLYRTYKMRELNELAFLNGCSN